MNKNIKSCKNCLNEVQKKNFECDVCLAVKSRLASIHSFTDNPNSTLHDLKKKYKRPHSKYDVCIGISGGVDSCMVATLAGEAGLKAKLIHFDNGWNTQKANKNIYSICEKYGFKLDTRIMDWKIFKSLQRSFFLSSVPDIELVTDHAIFATMTKELSLGEVPIFLNGSNFSTEHGLNLGRIVWNKLDILNIIAINKKFENISLKNYPKTNPLSWAKYRFFNRKSRIDLPLNNYWYKRNTAISYMNEKFGFEDYGFKHEESVFTKVYQRVVLKRKFNCIKVLPHINAQIRNKEFSKEEGENLINSFIDDIDLEQYEIEYVRQKLGFKSSEWEKILNEDPKCHSDYKNMGLLIEPIMKILSKLNLRAME